MLQGSQFSGDACFAYGHLGAVPYNASIVKPSGRFIGSLVLQKIEFGARVRDILLNTSTKFSSQIQPQISAAPIDGDLHAQGEKFADMRVGKCQLGSERRDGEGSDQCIDWCKKCQ